MHWADAFVKDLTGKQTVSTGISPSGHIHVGNMREILTGYFIHRAFQDKGTESRFIYLCDDMDPLRKVYPFLDKEKFEQHVGKPLSMIPAPDGEGTYGDYFLRPFLETLEKINVKVEVLKSTELYRQGIFADAIDTVMNNTEKIREILERVSGRDLAEDWSPYNPLCSSCGRINSTKVTGYSKPYVEYTCKCGHTGKSDIRKAEGKLPWRIEWPVKWHVLGVTVEPFGKDHGAAGSSYDTGKEIIEKIFNKPAPGYIIYERILLKGAGAMHSSKGNVVSAADFVHYAPPEIIRFLIARSQPNRHINFDPGLGLLNLVDEYEKFRNVYFGLEESPETDAGRIYELSRIREEKEGVHISFRHLVTLVQIYKEEDRLLQALQRSGYGESHLTDDLRTQVEVVNSWLEKYAPDQVKFSLLSQDEPVALSEKEKNLSAAFLNALPELEWNPESIHNSVHEMIKSAGFEPKEGFSMFYRILIGKERGPRLGYFLSNLDKALLENRFRFVVAN